jgi:hypothetical protein
MEEVLVTGTSREAPEHDSCLADHRYDPSEIAADVELYARARRDDVATASRHDLAGPQPCPHPEADKAER